MSHTFYDSDDFSIDETPDYIWFFEHRADGSLGEVHVPKEQLPAIARAINEHLRLDAEIEQRLTD